jgi:hypothetical protein
MVGRHQMPPAHCQDQRNNRSTGGKAHISPISSKVTGKQVVPDRIGHRALAVFPLCCNHNGMKRSLPCVAALLALVGACKGQQPPQKINIEVVGTPECLGAVTKIMADTNIGVARIPEWVNGVGTMEIGPIASADYGSTVKIVRSRSCAKAIRSRPCATPDSDINVCQ